MSGTFCRRPSFMGDSSPSVGTPNTCFQLGAAADFLLCHTNAIQEELKKLEHNRRKRRMQAAGFRDRIHAMRATVERIKVLSPMNMYADIGKLDTVFLNAVMTLRHQEISRNFKGAMKLANRDALAICKKAKRACRGS